MKNCQHLCKFFINVIYYSWIVQIPSQQSALLAQLLPSDEKSLWQLSFPQVKLPAQSESASQSPSPILHCLEDEQQLQSVVGTPLQRPAVGMVGVVGAPIPITSHIVEVYCLLKFDQGIMLLTSKVLSRITYLRNSQRCYPSYFQKLKNLFGNYWYHT